MAYTANPSDSSKPIDQDIVKGAAAELRALKDRINQLAAAAALPIVPATNQSGLTHLLYPSIDGGWRDIYRSGWKPAFFNQQWGGSQWGAELVDGATDDTYKFDVATGYVEDQSNLDVGAAAGTTQVSQGFKVSESGNYAAIWVKLYKNGNPTTNLQLTLYADDGTGTKPVIASPILNGAATAQSGKIHTSKTDGDWYRFVFVTPPALVAGTQYHYVLKSSGAVDATNYWKIKGVNSAGVTKKYPYGQHCNIDAANVATVFAAIAQCFIVENVNKFFLAGSGTFDSTLKMYEGVGNQISQSKALIQPLRNFFDGVSFTALHRVSNAVVNKPIADYLYGLDHDRIVLAVENTGFPSVKVYDKAGVVTTITGTSNITTAGTKDIAVVGRIKGDGADYMQLWVNGVKEAEVTLQTVSMNAEFRDFGHCWLGAGFSASPVWTQKLDMSTLPSANGWAWTGTALEANTMSISGGKLRQNKNGYAAGDNGYYQKAAAALSNANGWSVAWKNRVVTGSNVNADSASGVWVFDGAKQILIMVHEFFIQSYDIGVQFTVQGDFKANEHDFLLTGKGSDYYLYIDGKLAIDGTGKLVSATPNNQIQFGDMSVTAGSNADVTWDYLAYYSPADIRPQINSAALLHEYAHWSGNKSSLLPSLYNAGVHQSVKQFCGVEKSYIDAVSYEDKRKNTLGQNFTSATYASVIDTEVYVIGSNIRFDYGDRAFNSVAGQSYFSKAILDGSALSLREVFSGSTITGCTSHNLSQDSFLGLHKAEIRGASGGAYTTTVSDKTCTITSKA